MSWTNERIETLKALWAQGLSASQIAGRMGVTRNSVIGKVHRIGLSGRANPTISRAYKPRRPRRVQKDVSVAPVAQAAFPEPEPIPEIEIPPGQRRTILTLTERTCKWPIGDPGTPEFNFCGRKKSLDGEPYCPHHRRIAHQPADAYRTRRPRTAVAGNLGSITTQPRPAGRPAVIIDPAVAERIVETVADVAGIPASEFTKPDCKLPVGAFWRKISVYFLKQAGLTHVQTGKAVGRTKQGIADALKAIDRYPAKYEAALAQVGARL